MVFSVFSPTLRFFVWLFGHLFKGCGLFGNDFFLGFLSKHLEFYFLSGYFFWLVFPLKLTETQKFKVVCLLGKLTK